MPTWAIGFLFGFGALVAFDWAQCWWHRRQMRRIQREGHAQTVAQFALCDRRDAEVCKKTADEVLDGRKPLSVEAILNLPNTHAVELFDALRDFVRDRRKAADPRRSHR